MHPAYSVIFFTTASGAGYGLLFFLGILGALGAVPQSPWFGLAALGAAFMLITSGLLSSSLHLGRPERAWRAFSQWRSSWLSREGVLAVLTYIPAGILSLGWVLLGRLDGIVAMSGAAASVLAVMTIFCTGMIYASLPTIRSWHHPLVAPNYLVLGIASGAVLLNLMLAIFGDVPRWAAGMAFGLLGLAAVMKLAYWTSVDGAQRTLTVEDATGLGRFGKVRLLEMPHSQANFVMREMGYEIGRKHADKLRGIAMLLTFIVPMSCLLIVVVMQSQVMAIPLTLLATLSAGIGVVVERWLFFAEAEHVSMLYYGRNTA